MTPDQFVIDAVRTESRIEKVTINSNVYVNVVAAMIALGSILDQIKKNTFYKKPFDVLKLKQLTSEAQVAVSKLGHDIHIGNFPKASSERDVAVNTRYFHAVVGIATEAVELLQALDLNSNELDEVNLLEEFGDLNWYQAIGIDEANGNFEEVLNKVIAKLRVRFPDKFNSEQAINRDLVKEREVLESKGEETKPLTDSQKDNIV
jgi:NTP pyrophosphatase (non-canonical NTP hydrolase)